MQRMGKVPRRPRLAPYPGPFIVRPKGILGSPRKLAGELGWKTRYYPNPHRPNRTYDLRRDFLMVPVAPENLRSVTQDYLDAYTFFTRNKYGQRKLLEGCGVPIPRTAGSHGDAWGLAFEPGLRFVVRPHRHSGGRAYRITDNPVDFEPTTHYISELYPKKREYRIIFILGKPLVYLRKKPNEGIDASLPWGHVNSCFQTINDPANCRLANTDCIARLSATPFVRGAHICAADILYNAKAAQKYVVLELNACPALTIDENRMKIAEIIREKYPTPLNRMERLRWSPARSTV